MSGKQRRLERLAMDIGAVEALVRYLQSREDLTVDGDPGPITMGAIRREIDGEASSIWGPAVLAVALGEIGNGEEGRNNGGQHVARYQGVDDTGGDLGSWCAGFVSWCIEEAARRLDLPCPVRRSSWATTLASRCRHAGRAVHAPQPGDVMHFERGAPGGGTHIGIVESCDGARVWCIEGNVGPYPSVVSRQRHLIASDKVLGIYRLP